MAIGQPASADFCRRRGDTYPFTVTVTSDGTIPVDVTGFTYRLAVGPTENPDSQDTGQIFTNAPVVTDGPNGVITVTLLIVEAATPVGEYFYDLVQTDSSGFERTILSGKWDIE